MISKREEEILKLIVEDYIKNARPVSSKSLCDALNCSSATIRAEMNYLEEVGLLEKTHISSGRVPSEEGYRYYVDNIMEKKELSDEDKYKLQTIVDNKQLVVNDIILKSMEIISELTHYTTIVLGKRSSDNLVEKIEVVPVDDNNIVAIVVTNKGHVEHKNIYLRDAVDSKDIKQTVDLINKLIVGTSIDQVSEVLEYQIKPIIGKYVKQHEVLYNAFYNAFSDFASESVNVTGRQNILMQPEFNDADRIRDIVNKFEDKDIVNNIKEDSDGIKIYIGSESNFDDDVTVIKTKYKSNGEEGTIALIGPKRMEYDRVVTLLEYIMNNIDK